MLTEYSEMFHLKSCTVRRWLLPKKSHFQDYFLKVEYLKHIFLECVDGDGLAETSTPGAGLACRKHRKPQVALL